MVANTDKPYVRRFAVVGILGVFVIPFIGALVGTLTGWSPWITYGVPSLILFLLTLPLIRAVRHERAHMREAPDAKPGASTT